MNSENIFGSLVPSGSQPSDWYLPVVFFMVTAWSILWKGIALWHSARNSQKWWFIVLMVVNTLGVAELIYLFFFMAKDPWKNKIQKSEALGSPQLQAKAVKSKRK